MADYYVVPKSALTATADAIKEKTGSEEEIEFTKDGFKDAVEAIIRSTIEKTPVNQDLALKDVTFINELDLSGVTQCAYFLYDTHLASTYEFYGFAGLYIKLKTKGNATLRVGTISNGTFVEADSETLTSNNNGIIEYNMWLPTNLGRFVVLEITSDIAIDIIRPTVNGPDSEKYGGKRFDYNLQPLVAIRRKLPYSTTVTGNFGASSVAGYNKNLLYAREENLTSVCTSLLMAYCGAESLQLVEFIDCDLSSVSTMDSAFRRCYSLRGINGISNAFISCNSIGSAFENCYGLQSIEFSAGSLSEVTTLWGAFRNCYSLRSVTFPDGSLQKAENLRQAFESCYSLQSIEFPDGSLSDTTNLYSAFSNCYSLKSIAFPSGSLSKVTTLFQAFNGCFSLKSISNLQAGVLDGSGFGATFNGCKSLHQLSITIEDASNVGSLTNTYAECLFDYYNLDASFDSFSGWGNHTPNIREFVPPVFHLSISFANVTWLTKSSMLAVIDKLATVSTAQTLTIGTHPWTLTDEEIAVATAKGWTVA